MTSKKVKDNLERAMELLKGLAATKVMLALVGSKKTFEEIRGLNNIWDNSPPSIFILNKEITQLIKRDWIAKQKNSYFLTPKRTEMMGIIKLFHENAFFGKGPGKWKENKQNKKAHR